MADSGIVQVATIIGGIIGGLVGVGVVVEKVRGWIETHTTARETIAPPPPRHAGSLLDEDLAALRGRITELEAANARRSRDEAAERAEAVRRELKAAVREMTSALRGAKPKEKPDAPRETDPPTDP